jgi:hypothetical protein
MAWYDYIPSVGLSKLAYGAGNKIADFGSQIYGAYKAATQPAPVSQPTAPAVTPTDNSGLLAAIDYWKNKNTSVNYYGAAPTMPEYKPMNYSWEQAMSEAAPSVNTYYDKTLQDYLKTVETRKTRTTEDLATANANYDTQGRYLGEDTATTLGNLATGAKLSGQGEAITATANRAGLQGGLAGAGLTFSGVGQEKLNQGDVARRLSLAAASAQLNQQIGAAKTTKVRGEESITTGKKAAATASTRALEDLTTEQTQKKQDLEYQRAADISTKAEQLYSQQRSSWIANNPEWASILGG